MTSKRHANLPAKYLDSDFEVAPFGAAKAFMPKLGKGQRQKKPKVARSPSKSPKKVGSSGVVKAPKQGKKTRAVKSKEDGSAEAPKRQKKTKEVADLPKPVSAPRTAAKPKKKKEEGKAGEEVKAEENEDLGVEKAVESTQANDQEGKEGSTEEPNQAPAGEQSKEEDLKEEAKAGSEVVAGQDDVEKVQAAEKAEEPQEDKLTVSAVASEEPKAEKVPAAVASPKSRKKPKSVEEPKGVVEALKEMDPVWLRDHLLEKATESEENVQLLEKLLPTEGFPQDKKRKAEDKDAKKKKRKKDPNAPKRAMSGFMHFSQANRKKTMEEHPGLGFTELGRHLGERWRNMSDAEKAPFNQMATEEKAEYEGKMRDYKKHIHDAAHAGDQEKLNGTEHDSDHAEAEHDMEEAHDPDVEHELLEVEETS